MRKNDYVVYIGKKIEINQLRTGKYINLHVYHQTTFQHYIFMGLFFCFVFLFYRIIFQNVIKVY
jgi:hypothetical protein